MIHISDFTANLERMHKSIDELIRNAPDAALRQCQLLAGIDLVAVTINPFLLQFVETDFLQRYPCFPHLRREISTISPPDDRQIQRISLKCRTEATVTSVTDLALFRMAQSRSQLMGIHMKLLVRRQFIKPANLPASTSPHCVIIQIYLPGGSAVFVLSLLMVPASLIRACSRFSLA
jgi:hypothetical protein